MVNIRHFAVFSIVLVETRCLEKWSGHEWDALSYCFNLQLLERHM